MNVEIIAHTQLSEKFIYEHGTIGWYDPEKKIAGVNEFEDTQALALIAIRTCYSHLYPTEILEKEGEKYFSNAATDGEGGKEADRLFRHITRSGHTSTLEHINYTFAIEGVSRSLLAQLTRHRHLSFSVQSQRYVRMGSEDKIGGFEIISPPSLEGKYSTANGGADAGEVYMNFMSYAQACYDELRHIGVPAEDARMVLPNAAACNMVMTGNLRSLLDFYAKRQKGKGAQWEIAELAERIKEEVVGADPWLEPYFGGAK